ncbi:MAG: acetyl-CoA carboxylase, biotin carboxyl carrier protein, partial [Hyphomicrobiaceae bacterium]|nr:acetyl-CoA carboxylase, biotin carboxyl carrier protein [Hyphomicrobiaceae bacterium]
LNEMRLSEIEIERGDLKIRVAGKLNHIGNAATGQPFVGLHETKAPHQQELAEDKGADLHLHPGAVKSPMVGTAYLSPEPGASSFVDVGSKVSKGQTLLIIEAMKTMNHIPAPKAGVVKKVLVENKHPVEFGELLLIIE